MATEREIYQIIETQIEDYATNQIKRLIGHGEIETDELHALRGRAQAAKELAIKLRNALGYEPEHL